MREAHEEQNSMNGMMIPIPLAGDAQTTCDDAMFQLKTTSFFVLLQKELLKASSAETITFAYCLMV